MIVVVPEIYQYMLLEAEVPIVYAGRVIVVPTPIAFGALISYTAEPITFSADETLNKSQPDKSNVVKLEQPLNALLIVVQ